MSQDREERREALLRMVERLKEVLARDLAADSVLMDAAIKRFEFSFELFWRWLQEALQQHGIRAASPRAAFRAGAAQGWLDREAAWLAMIKDRNRIPHTYEEEVAKDVLSRLPDHLPAMRAALAKLPAD